LGGYIWLKVVGVSSRRGWLLPLRGEQPDASIDSIPLPVVPASRCAKMRTAAAFAGQSPAGDCFFRLTQKFVYRKDTSLR
jgi:hypothetical protein